MAQQEKKAKEKKQVTFTISGAKLLGYGLGFTFMLLWVFALGVMVGRGDVNRLFQRWGLTKADLAARLGAPTVDPTPAALVPPSGPVSESGQKAGELADSKPSTEIKTALPPPQASSEVVNKPQDLPARSRVEVDKKPENGNKTEAKGRKGSNPEKPVTGSSIASKLSFQNRLDSTSHKPAKTAKKKESGMTTASMTPTLKTEAKANIEAAKKKAAAYQVKVAYFHNAQDAQKALADLKKKGFAVSLQQGKDKNGTAYIIRSNRLTSKTEAEKMSKKFKQAKFSGQIEELKQ
ncbi:SPOR domain-containing protein [Desulfobacca acetoxidans]